jgi:protein involved in polysaccharide export with SLBB domain
VLLFLGSIAAAQLSRTESELSELQRLRALEEDRQEPVETSALDRVIEPEEYVVGPGDEITIMFTGKFVKRYSLKITPEGYLLIPEFGPVDIARMSLADAKDRLLRALKTRYRDVSISVLLTGVRKVKVSVSGEVENSGVYTVSAGDRVSEAIRRAGEATRFASERNIRVIRNGKVLRADLLSFFRVGIGALNPYVQEGDAIVVPTLEQKVYRVGIYGAVRSAGNFEYSDTDHLSDLIMLGYGLKFDADSSFCELVRFEPDHVKTKTIRIELPSDDSWEDSVANVKLMPDDRVYFRSKPAFHYAAQVEIRGEVVHPGFYPIIEDSTKLSEVINRAGGFTEDASLVEARMDRKGFESIEDTDLERHLKLSANELNDVEREFLKYESADRPGRVSVDFVKIFVQDDTTYDVTLKDGDEVLVPKVSNTVRVIGNVLKPGLIEYVKGADHSYYIERSGGFGWRANEGKVRIVKSISGAIVEPGDDAAIEVGDAIVVPEERDFDWWAFIKDAGVFLANLATVYIVIDQVIE